MPLFSRYTYNDKKDKFTRTILYMRSETLKSILELGHINSEEKLMSQEISIGSPMMSTRFFDNGCIFTIEGGNYFWSSITNTIVPYESLSVCINRFNRSLIYGMNKRSIFIYDCEFGKIIKSVDLGFEIIYFYLIGGGKIIDVWSYDFGRDDRHELYLDLDLNIVPDYKRKTFDEIVSDHKIDNSKRDIVGIITTEDNIYIITDKVETFALKPTLNQVDPSKIIIKEDGSFEYYYFGSPYSQPITYALHRKSLFCPLRYFNRDSDLFDFFLQNYPLIRTLVLIEDFIPDIKYQIFVSLSNYSFPINKFYRLITILKEKYDFNNRNLQKWYFKEKRDLIVLIYQIIINK